METKKYKSIMINGIILVMFLFFGGYIKAWDILSTKKRQNLPKDITSENYQRVLKKKEYKKTLLIYLKYDNKLFEHDMTELGRLNSKAIDANVLIVVNPYFAEEIEEGGMIFDRERIHEVRSEIITRLMYLRGIEYELYLDKDYEVARQIERLKKEGSIPAGALDEREPVYIIYDWEKRMLISYDWDINAWRKRTSKYIK